ncbi:MAG: hypothetical protein LJE62_15700 [Silicimonas sp.]|jgi:DnaJ-class molecular chaperone|nr:hypothetical protein [Silicimonas sp.]
MIEFERSQRQRKIEPTKRRCHRCHGQGRCACHACGGTGKVVTSRDVMKGPEMGRCTACFGNKTRRCPNCGGEGFVT